MSMIPTTVHRHATRVFATAAIAFLAVAGSAGCLLPNRDYEWRGDLAVLSPEVSLHLVDLYNACGREWGCTQARFHEFIWQSPTSFARIPGEEHRNFFAKGGPGDAFARVADQGQVWHAVPALNAVTTYWGLCLGLPAMPSQDWSAQPCW
jgi:hypothetical protein